MSKKAEEPEESEKSLWQILFCNWGSALPFVLYKGLFGIVCLAYVGYYACKWLIGLF
jgi:hypothetical protein